MKTIYSRILYWYISNYLLCNVMMTLTFYMMCSIIFNSSLWCEEWESTTMSPPPEPAPTHIGAGWGFPKPFDMGVYPYKPPDPNRGYYQWSRGYTWSQGCLVDIPKLKVIDPKFITNPEIMPPLPKDLSPRLDFTYSLQKFKEYQELQSLSGFQESRKFYLGHLQMLLESKRLGSNNPMDELNVQKMNQYNVLLRLTEMENYYKVNYLNIFTLNDEYLSPEFQPTVRTLYQDINSIQEASFGRLVADLELLAHNSQDRLTIHFLAYMNSLDISTSTPEDPFYLRRVWDQELYDQYLAKFPVTFCYERC